MKTNTDTYAVFKCLRALFYATVFDASTKFPQGIFSGYTHHLGNFDECIGIVAQTVDEDRKFNGKHCLVTLTLNNSGETTKNVVWSVCVPSSCKVSELRDILSNILPEGVSINIDKNNCSVNEGISLEPRDWIVAILLSPPPFFSMRLSGAYKTVPTNALCVTLGVWPQHLEVRKRAAEYWLGKGKLDKVIELTTNDVSTKEDIGETLLVEWQAHWEESTT
ncbi:unnamed protein product, partial [Timema podura]|nr:unnamed protein product [Timema podura]